MRKVLLSVSVLALGVVTAAGAGTVYVPVVQPSALDGHRLPTHLWVSNLGTEEISYRSSFLPVGVDGAAFKSLAESAPRKVAVDRVQVVDDAAESGRTGLLAIEANSEVQVDAWIETHHGRQTYMGGVPIISDENRFEAGTAAFVNGVSRVHTAQIALVNLGADSAACSVDFVRADGTLAGGNAQVTVPAVSLGLYDDALGLRQVKEEVSVSASCDQPFFAFAVENNPLNSRVTFISPASQIAAAPVIADSLAPITFDRPGQVHTATKEKPKLKLAVPVSGKLNLNELGWEVDITAGPWNAKKPECAHNIAFFHRGKFRSNTFSNLNAFGPKRNWLKNNQNIDQPPGVNTNAKIGFHFVQGTTYHIIYIFDAVNKRIHISAQQGGETVGHFDMNATAQNHILTVPATGLVLEMGNLLQQAGCEVPSLGWSWSNLRLTMFPR
ncbi:MAG TPA: hypothetical protein VGS07_33940 [Thermoanaerobaculia bacterium]|jgi:hypothetical protein|nr:hypothetical protein [Thermoanaerobaculia bacterium]